MLHKARTQDWTQEECGENKRENERRREEKRGEEVARERRMGVKSEHEPRRRNDADERRPETTN